MRIGSTFARASAAASLAVILCVGAAGCAAHGPDAVPQPGGVDADLPADTQTELEGAVTDAMAATGATGAIVGVWAPWSGTWVSGLGTEGVKDQKKVTAEMTFRAGAITRPMTCDALYQAVDAGDVRLDDPITAYVGGLPNLDEVSLAELCDGTSGIGSYSAQLSGQWRSNPDREWSRRELVAYGMGQVAADGPLEPGKAWVDSDAGYVLLGLALEKGTGKSSADQFDRDVFDPLGLEHTELPGRPAAEPSVDGSPVLKGAYLHKKVKKSKLYDCSVQTDVSVQSASFASTDSGVVSSITDVGRYVRALADGSLVSAKDRFADARSMGDDTPSWLSTAGGAIIAGPMIGQYGEVPGYLSAAFSDPESGLTVAVVLNNSTAGAQVAGDLAFELAAIASKAPAAKGQNLPAVGLPWSAKDYHEAVAKAAVCAPEK